MDSPICILPAIAKTICQCVDLKAVKTKILDFASKNNDLNQTLLTIHGSSMNLLHFAVAADTSIRDDIVSFLINEMKMEVNVPYGNEYWTPGHVAAAYGFHTTLKILLKAGADIYLPDVDGNTVADIASIYGWPLCSAIIERFCRCKDDTIVIEDDDDDFDIKKPIIRTEEKNGHRFTITHDPFFNVTLVEDTLMTLDLSTTDSFVTATQSPPADLSSLSQKLSPSIICPRSATNDQNLNTLTPRRSIDLLTDDDIFNGLKSYGDTPPPVVKSTRNFLLNRLKKHQRANEVPARNLFSSVQSKPQTRVKFDLEANTQRSFESSSEFSPPLSKLTPLPMYSMELNLFIGWLRDDSAKREENLQDVKRMYHEMKKHYSCERTALSFFNYLLLDPRNLVTCLDDSMNANENTPNKFEEFLNSIFYIGKGQGKRPLMHLYEAALEDQRRRRFKSSGDGREKKSNAKVNRILEIWDNGFGVISIPVFHHITTNEALACESFMIEAIKLQNLTNVQTGHKKGRLLNMTNREKKYLGSFLLYKAFMAYLVDGNTQIKRDGLGD